MAPMRMVSPVPPGSAAGVWLWGAALLFAVAGWQLQGTTWDRSLFLALNAWSPHWALTASTLSVLGLGAAALTLAGFAGPGSARRPTLVAAVLLVVLAGGLAVQVVKLAVASPRPLQVLGPDVVHLVGVAMHARSMPSGHSALWAAMATLAWLLVPAGGRLRHIALAAAMTLLAIAGALARVLVGAHWPADLLVGAGAGVAVAGLVAGTARDRRQVQALAAALQGRSGSRLMAALMVGLAASHWVAEVDDPAAAACHGGLSLLGLAAAWRWWRLHPGPVWRWLPAARRTRKTAS